MLTLAATSTPDPATYSDLLVPLAWLLLAGLIAAPFYLGLCWIWPFTACRRCHGAGKRGAWIGRGFRYCTHCDGTGARLRAGRHVLNYLRRTHRAGHR
ncbi:hypothetical protein [Cryptosporangium aurantiacum]|uniref:Uncharacterized protein n=1 Tax=Cryptosporangium aurantiacum TaxID=134849 RepID=A0A1M7NN59_9ACTN|nr:hypothetical protein [Cryptosporangium aurantiacum]SHN04952.1 hypothetical protein SAMN05443668_102720 [Cryptosporangium aurantiacum]